MAINKPNKIFLHCAATPEGKNYKAADIDRWHRAQGWSKIGYHYVIDLDGTIETGRAENVIGAHCSGYNTNSIGICYIGGVDSKGKPKDTRTEAQKKSLLELVKRLMDKYSISLDRVYGHYQLSKIPKACPSFKIEDWKREFEGTFIK